MESKSWPARGERGAPTRCWQDREMRGRWGKRIGQSAARPREPSSDEQPRATLLPGQDPKGRKTGAPKTFARARAQRLPGGAAPMSADGGVNQARCVQTLGLSPAIKRDEVLTRPTTWGALGAHTSLRKINQSPKATCFPIPFIMKSPQEASL